MRIISETVSKLSMAYDVHAGKRKSNQYHASKSQLTPFGLEFLISVTKLVSFLKIRIIYFKSLKILQEFNKI